MIEKNERLLKFLKEETEKEKFNAKKEYNIKTIDLIRWYQSLNMKPKNFKIRHLIIEQLLSSGLTYLDFYNRFNDRAYGIHPSRFSNKFKVNQYQRHKMQEQGFIKILYIKNEEIYPNRFEKVPYYDPIRYFSMTQEGIEEWKAVNIKGYININQCNFFDMI